MKISIKREQNNARISSAEREKVRTKFKKFLSMAALALVGAVMTGCSGDDDSIAETPQQPGNKGNVVTLTTTVGLEDGGAQTRALTGGGVKTFAEGETMAVVYNNGSTTVKAVSHPLDAGDIADGAKTATFTFDLETPNASVPVTYIYPAAMANSDGSINYDALATQDGTLATLSSSLDLATKTAAWEGTSLPAATLENQLAILACTLKNNDGSSNITSSITSMTVSDGSNSYAVTGHDSDGHIYVAIRPTAAAALEVNASTGIVDYTKTATSREYAAGNGYSLSWRMAVGKTTPMTMEATSDGTIVVKNPQSGMQYRLNGGTKTAMTVTTTIEVKAGDKVQFYGNGETITNYYGTYISGGTATVKMYGNIMSLVDEERYATATSLTENYAFAALFMGSGYSENDKLTDASGLLLPATGLTTQCYLGMFCRCTSLTAAPALSAKTLASQCYKEMFAGCTKLTTAPALPAETLAENCYERMFQGCTSLTTAPELTVKTLVSGCYSYMFYGCSSLNAVTCLATSRQSTSTKNWLSGVAATGMFTKNKNYSWSEGADGIPSGWTVVDAQ